MISASMISEDALERIEFIRKKYEIPGLAIGVVGPTGVHSNGDLEEASFTFGVRNPDGDPYDEDTIFGIASNSKLFSALSLSILMDREIEVTPPNGTSPRHGETLSWSTRVKDIWGDEWSLPDKYAEEHAVLDDLAGMRLGTCTHMHAKKKGDQPMDWIRNLRHLPMSLELRQGFQYEQTGYEAFSDIVSRLSGQTYMDFLRSEIYEPLGMTDGALIFQPEKIRLSGRATDGYIRQGGNRANGGIEGLGSPRSLGWFVNHGNASPSIGGGGLSMCITDMTKFLRELISPQHLSPKAINSRMAPLSATSPRISPFDEGAPVVYARGQTLSIWRGFPTVFHWGGTHGQISLLLCLPGKKTGIFIHVNDGTLGSQMIKVCAYMILDDVLKLDPQFEYEKKFFGPSLAPLASLAPVKTPHRQQNGARDVSGTYFHIAYLPLKLRPFLKNSSMGQAIIDAARMTELPGAYVSHLLFRPIPQSEGGPHPDEVLLFEWSAFSVFDIYLDTKTNSRGERAATGNKVAAPRLKGPALFTSTGVGMFGGFWGIVPGGDWMDRKINDELLSGDARVVEDKAEVWFARV